MVKNTSSSANSGRMPALRRPVPTYAAPDMEELSIDECKTEEPASESNPRNGQMSDKRVFAFYTTRLSEKHPELEGKFTLKGELYKFKLWAHSTKEGRPFYSGLIE